MTNLDDNLPLLSPCMFTNGNNSVDISRTPEAPASCTWGHGNTSNSYSKTDNIMTWEDSLTLTNEPRPLHASKPETCPWKSSNFHEKQPVVDDIITNCCGESVSKGSEELNRGCWNSGLLLVDTSSHATDHSAEESSPWGEDLSAIDIAPPGNSRSTGAKSRGTSRAKKTRVSPAKYKHVPHRHKPPQIVARRNARERRRVQAVNSAFTRLRKVVPIDNHR